MKYDYTVLEEKIKSLPQDMQVAMFSSEISEKVQEIAEKYSLDIEQTGILMDITSYVMLALIPSKSFIAELAKEANIDSTKSAQIAKDINDQVFAGIRESLRKMQDIAEKNAVEQANPSDTADLNKADILAGIENGGIDPNLPVNIIAASPLVDRLMSAPVATANETVEKKAPAPATPTPAPAPRPAGPDPYREPIE